MFGKMSPVERQLHDQYYSAIKSAQIKDAGYNETLISKLASAIKKTSEFVPHPSILRCLLIDLFQKTFADIYGQDLPFRKRWIKSGFYITIL